MSITITITEVRPDVGTSFFVMPAEWISYVKRYNSVRNGSGGVAEFSEDQLTKTSRVQFASAYDYETFQNDPTVKLGLDAMSAYNTANNITQTSINS